MAITTDFEPALFAMSEEELIAKVGARGPAEERGEALRTLARRSIKRAAPTLRNVARKAAPIASMRATAAIALGRDADPANQAPLIAALKAPEDRVVRRAAEALGRIGDAKALAALRAARVPSAPAAARAHGFAQSLISYRLGLGSDLVVARVAVAERGRKGEKVEATAIPPATFKRIAACLPEEVPAIALAKKGGVAFTCCGADYLVLLAERAGDLARANAVAAVVLRRGGPLNRFALHLYLLTHPAGGNNLAIHGARPDGTVTYRGEVTPTKNGHAFHLEALATPLARPALIEGQLSQDGAKVILSKTKMSMFARLPGVAAARAPAQG